jgi:hypothetical protein
MIQSLGYNYFVNFIINEQPFINVEPFLFAACKKSGAFGKWVTFYATLLLKRTILLQSRSQRLNLRKQKNCKSWFAAKKFHSSFALVQQVMYSERHFSVTSCKITTGTKVLLYICKCLAMFQMFANILVELFCLQIYRIKKMHFF